jgi:hypothetical protein
MQPPQSRKDV